MKAKQAGAQLRRDHGKGMWYIREDAETDMKVWAAEQLTPRPRGVYYTPTIRFDDPSGVSSAWEDYETAKKTVYGSSKDDAKTYVKPAETLAERKERERLEALKKED